jgi:predicted acyltransferase
LQLFPRLLYHPAEEAISVPAQTIVESVSNAEPPRSAATRPPRLVSLDVFRGVTIAAMILVNDPGSWSHVYAPLEHADWNGWTPTDLIFPFFLFIVGVSMTLSFAARVARGASRKSLALHVIRRSAIIFLIGLFLNGFPDFDFSTIRIMGVLQRIAICYLVAGLLYLATYRESLTEGGTAIRANVPAIALTAIILLAGYWAVMKLVPVPGYGVGGLGKEDNLAAYIDRSLMGGHLWSESKTWDPEGFLSTLPALATLLMGILAGEWLRSRETAARKFFGLAASGLVLVLLGEIFDRWFPINKSLWTSSFALFTVGCALLALALCYWAVDVRGWRRVAWPALVFGMNAILAYALAALLSEVSDAFEFHYGRGHSATLHGLVYRHFTSHLSPLNASLAFAILFVIIVFALIWPLYRARIFVRI